MTTPTLPAALVVPLGTSDPAKMIFMGPVVTRGTLDDDRPFEVVISGRTIVLEVGRYVGNDSSGKVVQTLELLDLVRAWERALLDEDADPTPQVDVDDIVEQIRTTCEEDGGYEMQEIVEAGEFTVERLEMVIRATVALTLEQVTSR